MIISGGIEVSLFTLKFGDDLYGLGVASFGSTNYTLIFILFDITEILSHISLAGIFIITKKPALF